MSIPIEEDIAPCPGHSGIVAVDTLCEHDDETTGPLCPRCCRRDHQEWVA